MADNGDGEEPGVSSSAEVDGVSSTTSGNTSRRPGSNEEMPGSSSSVPDSSTDTGARPDSSSAAGVATSAPTASSPDSSTATGVRADSSFGNREATSGPQAGCVIPPVSPALPSTSSVIPPTNPALPSASSVIPPTSFAMLSGEQRSPINLSTEKVEMPMSEESPPEQCVPLDLSPEKKQTKTSSLSSGTEEQTDPARKMTTEQAGPSGYNQSIGTEERPKARGSPAKVKFSGLSSGTEAPAAATLSTSERGGSSEFLGAKVKTKAQGSPLNARTSGSSPGGGKVTPAYSTERGQSTASPSCAGVLVPSTSRAASAQEEIDRFLSLLFMPVPSPLSPMSPETESSQSRESPDTTAAQKPSSLPTGSFPSTREEIISPGDSSSSSGFSTLGLSSISGEQTGVSEKHSSQGSSAKQGGSTDSPLSTGEEISREEISSPGESSSSGFSDVKEVAATLPSARGEPMDTTESTRSSETSESPVGLPSSNQECSSFGDASTSSGISAGEVVNASMLSSRRIGAADTIAVESPAAQSRNEENVGASGETRGEATTRQPISTSSNVLPEAEEIVRAEPDSARSIEMARQNPRLTAMLSHREPELSELARRNPSLLAMLRAPSRDLSELVRGNPSLLAMLRLTDSSGQSELARRNPSLTAMLRQQPPTEDAPSEEAANSPLLLSLLRQAQRGRGVRWHGCDYDAARFIAAAFDGSSAAGYGGASAGAAAGYGGASAGAAAGYGGASAGAAAGYGGASAGAAAGYGGASAGAAAGYGGTSSGAAAGYSGSYMSPEELEAERQHFAWLDRQVSFDDKFEQAGQESTHPEETGEAVVPDLENPKLACLGPSSYRGTMDSPPYTLSSYDSSDGSRLGSEMESPMEDFEQSVKEATIPKTSTVGTSAVATSATARSQQQAIQPQSVTTLPPAEMPAVGAGTSITASIQRQAAQSLRIMTQPPAETPSTVESERQEAIQPQNVIPQPPAEMPAVSAATSATSSLQQQAYGPQPVTAEQRRRSGWVVPPQQLSIIAQPPSETKATTVAATNAKASPQRQTTTGNAKSPKTPDSICLSPEARPSVSSPSTDALLSPFEKLATNPRFPPCLSPSSILSKRRFDELADSGGPTSDVTCSPKKILATESRDSSVVTPPVGGSLFPAGRTSVSSPSADLCSPMEKLSTKRRGSSQKVGSPKKGQSPVKKEESPKRESPKKGDDSPKEKKSPRKGEE